MVAAISLKRDLESITYQLSDEEVGKVFEVSKEAFEKYDSINNPDFNLNYFNYSLRLPFSLRSFLFSFKLRPYDCYLIKGIPLDDEKLGPTPEHWCKPKNGYTRLLQFVNYLIASCAGQPYGWQTQQNGSLISDVLPIAGFEQKQQGFGSIGGLRFHTEDPFHVCQADYFTLMCMRNITKTPTTVFPVDLTQIPDEYKAELFKTQFAIIPDESHTQLTYGGQVDIKDDLDQSFSEYNQTRFISILYGRYESPYLRIDPEIMDVSGLSPEARRAFDFMLEVIDEAKTGVVLEQGHILLLNNHRLAHGRGSFKANYDGKDRWLERVLTLDDMRKSVHLRKSEYSNIVVR